MFRCFYLVYLKLNCHYLAASDLRKGKLSCWHGDDAYAFARWKDWICPVSAILLNLYIGQLVRLVSMACQ